MLGNGLLLERYAVNMELAFVQYNEGCTGCIKRSRCVFFLVIVPPDHRDYIRYEKHIDSENHTVYDAARKWKRAAMRKEWKRNGKD